MANRNDNVEATDDQPGLLLIGHGTRYAPGREEMLELARRVAERLPGVVCQPCWLEFANPTIAAGVDLLVAQGVRRIVAMPLMLFAAGHVKEDIPAAIDQAIERHPGVTVRLAGYFGCHPKIVELAALRFRQALELGPAGEPSAASETLLLMVGRGSRDSDANAEMARFSRLVFEQVGAGWLEVCFTALAEPSLQRGLDHVLATSFRRVVVQPHLLFPGELLGRIRTAVETIQPRQDQQWLLAGHLGVHELTLAAVLEITDIEK